MKDNNKNPVDLNELVGNRSSVIYQQAHRHTDTQRANHF